MELTHHFNESSGKDYYYKLSFKIDNNYTESDKWQTIMQFHDKPDFESGETWDSYSKKNSKLAPPIMLQYRNKKISIVLYKKDLTRTMISEKAIEKGKWIDIIFHIKWDYDNKGYLEAWLNNENITNGKVFHPTIYNNSCNFLKIGLYRDKTISTTNTIYFDDIKFGKSMRSVTKNK